MHSQLTTLTNILLTNIFSQFVLTNICSQICLTIFVWLIFFLSPHCTHSLPNNAMMEHMIKFCQYLCTFSTHFQYQHMFNTFANTSVNSQYAASRADNNQTAVYQLLWLSLSRGEIFWLGFACTYKTSSPGQLTKQPNNWRSAQMYTLPPSLNVTSRREGRQRKHL